MNKRKFLIYILIIAGIIVMIVSFAEKISFFTGLLLFSLGIVSFVRHLQPKSERQKILKSLTVIFLLILIIASIIVKM